MQPWIVIVIVVAIGALFWVAQHFGWIDLSNKSRTSGGGGGIAGIGDEVFNPTRYEAQIELDRQTILPAPAPLPGDDDFGVAIRGAAARDDLDNKNYDGQVRIDLSGQTEAKRGKHADD
ncbi:hypothetical protein BH11ACT5_BH11ACT5_03420 [soil metagenome]